MSQSKSWKKNIKDQILKAVKEKDSYIMCIQKQ